MMNRSARALPALLSLTLFLCPAPRAQVGTPAQGDTDSAALQKKKDKEKDIFAETQKFTEIFQYIKKMYFRPVDERVLLDGAIEGLLQAVDRNDTFVVDAHGALNDVD